MREARDQIAATNRNLPPIADWSVQRSLDEMDRNGVRTAVASVTNPGIWFGDRGGRAKTVARLQRISGASCRGSSATLRRVCNAAVAGHRRQPRRDRLQLRFLKADGIGLMTSYDDKWPGDAAFAPVFAELNRRKAVVYFHPTSTNCCTAHIPDVSLSVIEFPIDTTRAVTSLSVQRRVRQISGHTLDILSRRRSGAVAGQPDGAHHGEPAPARLPHSERRAS